VFGNSGTANRVPHQILIHSDVGKKIEKIGSHIMLSHHSLDVTAILCFVYFNYYYYYILLLYSTHLGVTAICEVIEERHHA